jgi:hypothetical protein
VKNLVVVGVALALSVSNAVGQSGSKASPADVAREFFAAQRDGRWLDAAHLLDLKSFESRRAQSIANARDTHPFHLTVERLLRDDPSMPRAVAEYQVKQSETFFRDFNPLSVEFAGIQTADSLAKLPIDVVAARWLEARDPRWQIKQHPQSIPAECAQGPDSELKSKKIQMALAESAAAMFTPPPREVVAVTGAGPRVPGSVDSVSYVLFRDRYERVGDSAVRTLMASPETRVTPSVLTLIRTPNGWRVVPVPDLGYSGLVSGFGASIHCAIDSVEPPSKKK